MSECQIIAGIVCTECIIEFLEVAFNNILYSRKIYPAELFKKARVYSTAVHVCQHPEVNEYITNVLTAIRALINTEPAERKLVVNFNILSKDNLIEKYVFNLENMKVHGLLEKDPYMLKLDEQLRTVCLKLSMATAYLKSLPPDDSSFTINVETSRRSYAAMCEKNAICQNFPWIVISDDQDSTETQNYVTNLLPLTTIKNEIFSLEMFVLENEKRRD